MSGMNENFVKWKRSATAQQLTSEFDALGIIDGAVYVFALQELGEANGFEVGDVILAVGGVSTMDVSGFLAAVEFVADRETAEVDVLRLTPEGQFSEVEIDARVVDGTLGVGAMPI